MVDKDFCISSYLAFRYIEDDNKDFSDDFKHQNIVPVPEDERIPVKNAKEIDSKIAEQMEHFADKKNQEVWIRQLLRHTFRDQMHTHSDF